jgi:hypothetical protein
MHVSPVLSPQGLPVFSVGGKHAYKTASYRGFCVSLEWVISNSKRRAAPMLAIWREPVMVALAPQQGGGIWAIGRRAITEFVGFDANGKCTGSASEHCLREAREALPLLGFDKNDKQALMALVDVVVKYAPELALMPPTPKWLQEQDAPAALWDVKAIDKQSGKTLDESEV